MPRYFFDVRTNGATSRNGKGIEVPNLQLAVREAALALADMADDMATGAMGQETAISIRDEDDRIVAEVRFSVDLTDKPSDGA